MALSKECRVCPTHGGAWVCILMEHGWGNGPHIRHVGVHHWDIGEVCWGVGPLVCLLGHDPHVGARPASWGTRLLFYVIGLLSSVPEAMEIPLFTQLNGVNVGLSTLVGASAVATGFTMIQPPPAGEFNCSPSTGLPARLIRRIVDLEFVEMSELLHSYLA